MLPTRRAVAAMALTAMALSCAEEGRPPPFPFGRPREFEPACPGETVEVDGSTLVWTSEVMRSATGWTATVRGERLRFQGLDEIWDRSWGPRNLDGPLGPFCKFAKRAEWARAAREVDGVCLLGIDHGEFGGHLEAIEPGSPPTRRAIESGNVAGFLRSADGRSFLVVRSGWSDLAVGGLYRVLRKPDGAWCRAQSVRLHGPVVGWRLEGLHGFQLLVPERVPPGESQNRQGVRLVRGHPSG